MQFVPSLIGHGHVPVGCRNILNISKMNFTLKWLTFLTALKFYDYC
jgi:hypothetical protein